MMITLYNRVLFYSLLVVNLSAAFQEVCPSKGLANRNTNTYIQSRSKTLLHTHVNNANAQTSSSSSSLSTAGVNAVSQERVTQLKRILEREYASFFSPMEREWYAPDVTFDDPMTSLEGIQAYENNVNMLSAKTWLGKILFRDAGIVLHNIEGGQVQPNGQITDLITRWTLRFTFQIMPWQPTARFSGISVYKVKPGGGPKGIQITKQTDYWDSVNLINGGSYVQVSQARALLDFLNQLIPQNFAAPSAGPELPYQLLRRGADYEVRRYPSFVAVETEYERRDLGFSELGAFCSGMNPLAPAIMSITKGVDQSSSSSSSSSSSLISQKKTMMWPLAFALPGSNGPPAMTAAREKAKATATAWQNCKIVTMPERVVAVGSFSDACLEPAVRKADSLLKQACQRDGLRLVEGSALSFAQFDAIFSMGKRRGEVWVELAEGHAWSKGS